MSEIKVNSIKGVGASTAAITVNNTDGSCAVNNTQRQGKNLILNGAFQIAQRGTSSTSSSYQTVDRFITGHGGTDEAPTQAQHTLTSSDTGPYAEGFRFSYHITNGNQTSGAGAADNIYIRQRIEAQNVAQSGWDYTSTSSFITLQFWVKSSVAQNFYGYLRTADGTSQRYAFETGSLSANTWTKITKTIPGNSNLQIDNNNENGLEVVVIPFWGTDQTDSGVPLNAWGAFSSSTRTPDSTSTWYTTNDATFEITGVQLEVGSVATDFEHRSFAQELKLCQRYCQVYLNPKLRGVLASSDQFQRMGMTLLETMRADPSASWSGTQSVYAGSGVADITGITSSYPDPYSYEFDASTSGSFGVGTGSAICAYTGGNEATLTLGAEL